MTLVERFIDFKDWPASRKTARVAIIFAPAFLLLDVVVALAKFKAVDTPMLVRLISCGVLLGFVGAILGWAADRSGREGRWTAYWMVVTFAAWLWAVVYLFGFLTSAMVALPMMLGLFAALWWDARIALVGYLWGIGWFAFWNVVTFTNVLPFAPAMAVRDIDALRSTAWPFGVGVLVLVSSVMVYALGFVTVAAADLQSRRLERAHGLIRRYVPEQVADAVLSDTPEAIGRHERRKLTIFFSDLVGFTDLSDELEPEDLATVLHDYFTEMSAIARKHAGTVDDLIGDAVLVLFGAPDFTDDRDHALRAVRMAVEMQQAMGPLNERWASAGIPEKLSVRMGVNTGVATVGNFGSAERTKYTALGKQVNIAARIQSQCEPGKVLLGHATWLLVRDEISCTPIGELELKGLRKPMPAYEVQA